MLEFDHMLSLSLSGFAWHAFLVLSNLGYLKISLALQRSPDITMHNGTSGRNTHTHTYTQKRRQHTEHHLRTSYHAGLVVSAKQRNQHIKMPCDYNENNTSQSQSNTLITRFHSKHKILEVIYSSSPPALEHWYRLAQCLNSFHYPPLYTHHNLILSRPQAQKLL